MNKDERKGLALGAMVGAIAGVVTGILFAPKSGKETREDIRISAEKAAHKLDVEAHRLKREIDDLLIRVEASMKGAGKNVSDAALNLRETAKKARDSLVSYTSSGKIKDADYDKELDDLIKKAKEAKDSLSKYLQKNK